MVKRALFISRSIRIASTTTAVLLSSMIKFAIGKTRLSRSNEMDGSYSSHVSREGLLVFQSIIIHIVSWMGLAIDNIIDKDDHFLSDYDFFAAQ